MSIEKRSRSKRVAGNNGVVPPKDIGGGGGGHARMVSRRPRDWREITRTLWIEHAHDVEYMCVCLCGLGPSGGTTGRGGGEGLEHVWFDNRGMMDIFP